MFTLFLNNNDDLENIFLYSNSKKDLLDKNIKIEKNSDNIVFSNINSISNFSLWISNLIIDLFEKKIISNIIQKKYYYFDSNEQHEIEDISTIFLNDNSHSKKELIFISVNDFLKSNYSMNLDGFIRFRLKDYIEVLEYLVDLSANNFIINREYNKFIDLLIEYINNEPPKIELVHLVYLNQESILLDKMQNIIPINNAIFDAKFLSDITFSSNDYALNTLLNLLPNKLYVHILDKEDEFIKTLKMIFKNRLYICCNCDICNYYHQTILK